MRILKYYQTSKNKENSAKIKNTLLESCSFKSNSSTNSSSKFHCVKFPRDFKIGEKERELKDGENNDEFEKFNLMIVTPNYSVVKKLKEKYNFFQMKDNKFNSVFFTPSNFLQQKIKRKIKILEGKNEAKKSDVRSRNGLVENIIRREISTIKIRDKDL